MLHPQALSTPALEASLLDCALRYQPIFAHCALHSLCTCRNTPKTVKILSLSYLTPVVIWIPLIC